MKAKIQRSMLLVLFVTILIFYGLLTLVMYQKNLTLLKEEVNQEARYIRTAVDISGPAYLKEMDGVDIKTRVTRISTEGKVLYDSGNDAETLENHSKRPEVKEALASGTGEDVRVSGTVGKEMYYYAILLQDGSVLRVAKTMDNLGAMARDTLPVIGVLAVVMMIFAWILGRWQTERLIRPINELDIEHPLENVVYEEIKAAVDCDGQTEQRKSGSGRYEKRVFRKCLSRIENAADFDFRLCGDHEKRTGPSGGYSQFFRADLQRSKTPDHIDRRYHKIIQTG